MALYLESMLQEKNTGLNKYLSLTDPTFQCRCYPAGGEGDMANAGDRIFEVNSDVQY